MISKYFSKGDRIGVAGEIRTGSYTDRDGNKRYTFDVWINGVDFCNGGKGTQHQERQKNIGNMSNDNFENDGLPF